MTMRDASQGPTAEDAARKAREHHAYNWADSPGWHGDRIWTEEHDRAYFATKRALEGRDNIRVKVLGKAGETIYDVPVTTSMRIRGKEINEAVNAALETFRAKRSRGEMIEELYMKSGACLVAVILIPPIKLEGG